MMSRLTPPTPSKEAALDAATAEFRTWLAAELAKERKGKHEIMVSIDPDEWAVKLLMRPSWGPITTC